MRGYSPEWSASEGEAVIEDEIPPFDLRVYEIICESR